MADEPIEYMTHEGFLNLYATALIEQEDYGQMNWDTKSKVMRIKSGTIVVLAEGEVRPLENITGGGT